MKEKWYKKDNKIIIEIPYWSKRINPYMEGEDVGDYQTLTGLIIKHDKDGNNWDEKGFALTIDMDYKDKDDQYTDIMFHFTGEEERFIELCKKLKIRIMEFKDSSP